ncbi:MAG: ATP-binding protein [Candidatus Thermoplasmatota archaeon]
MQRATLNILEDLDIERRRAAQTQRASLNILDDLGGEREWQAEVQKAVLNILDDLGDEKDRTQVANVSLEGEIVKRRKAEEEIVAKAAELTRSNTELQQFAYIASHDLQEPLRTVSGSVSRLARRNKDQLDTEGTEYVRFALEGTARMQHLIEDLLSYSRVGTKGATPKPASAESVLVHTLATLQGAITDAHATITHDPLPMVLADESQLAQLLQNLLGNAIKFHGERPPVVHVGVTREGAFWRFDVKDNGIGIAPQYHERIFVIFQRLHQRDDYPGTGIGLAIAKKIVERHGGRIWVESAPGEGSTFHFTVPAITELMP